MYNINIIVTHTRISTELYSEFYTEFNRNHFNRSKWSESHTEIVCGLAIADAKMFRFRFPYDYPAGTSDSPGHVHDSLSPGRWLLVNPVMVWTSITWPMRHFYYATCASRTDIIEKQVRRWDGKVIRTTLADEFAGGLIVEVLIRRNSEIRFSEGGQLLLTIPFKPTI